MGDYPYFAGQMLLLERACLVISLVLALFLRIKSIVLLSILPIVSEIPTDKRCYEMFGYGEPRFFCLSLMFRPIVCR